jgi:hypothetical protein
MTSAGSELAHAIAAKDAAGVRDLLDPAVDFRGMTPNRSWEGSTPDEVVAVLFEHWFEPKDEIEAVERVETDAFADRERVGYRFSGHNPDGPFVVEQQAYLATRDGRIAWLRVMCSGFRPRG